jgi:hypothetical protein
MIVSGRWGECDDGFVRPLLTGFAFNSDDVLVPITFIIDTGADRTLLTAEVFAKLKLPPIGSRDRFSGVGGLQDIVQVQTKIGFRADNGHYLIYKSQYCCVTTSGTTDMPLLGRDLLDIFAVIVDRPGDRVCLLTEDHPYQVE